MWTEEISYEGKRRNVDIQTLNYIYISYRMYLFHIIYIPIVRNSKCIWKNMNSSHFVLACVARWNNYMMRFDIFGLVQSESDVRMCPVKWKVLLHKHIKIVLAVLKLYGCYHHNVCSTYICKFFVRFKVCATEFHTRTLYLDGSHGAEKVDWIVVEVGTAAAIQLFVLELSR